MAREARPRLTHQAAGLCPQWPRAKAKPTVTFATLAFSGASRRRTAAMRSSLCSSSSDSLLIHASWFLFLSSLFAWAKFLPVKQNQSMSRVKFNPTAISPICSKNPPSVQEEREFGEIKGLEKDQKQQIVHREHSND